MAMVGEDPLLVLMWQREQLQPLTSMVRGSQSGESELLAPAAANRSVSRPGQLQVWPMAMREAGLVFQIRLAKLESFCETQAGSESNLSASLAAWS